MLTLFFFNKIKNNNSILLLFLKKNNHIFNKNNLKNYYFNKQFFINYVDYSNTNILKIKPGFKKNFYFFGNFNNLNLKKFNNFFNNFLLNGNKFVFLDKNYSSLYNLYSDNFYKNNLKKNKDYFFPKNKFFSFKNWIYYYYNFCFKNDINLVIISDYFYFKKHINELNKYCIITVVFQPINISSVVSDFYLYVNNDNIIFYKFIYIIYINNIFYNYCSLKKNNYKLIYKNNFFKIKRIL